MRYLLFGFLFVFLLGAKCEQGATDIKIGERAALAPGQTAICKECDKLTVTFLTVVSDSRCPKYTNCLRAGEAKIALSMNGSTDPVTIELEAEAKTGSTHLVGDYQVIVQSLNPYPEDGKNTKPEDYRLGLSFQKAAKK